VARKLIHTRERYRDLHWIDRRQQMELAGVVLPSRREQQQQDLERRADYILASAPLKRGKPHVRAELCSVCGNPAAHPIRLNLRQEQKRVVLCGDRCRRRWERQHSQYLNLPF
jgi:hypothetical protein